jgi:hypothetical protein
MRAIAAASSTAVRVDRSGLVASVGQHRRSPAAEAKPAPAPPYRRLLAAPRAGRNRGGATPPRTWSTPYGIQCLPAGHPRFGQTPLVPHRARDRTRPVVPRAVVELVVQVDRGADERQVAECLREVAELLAGAADLFGVQAEVVRRPARRGRRPGCSGRRGCRRQARGPWRPGSRSTTRRAS